MSAVVLGKLYFSLSDFSHLFLFVATGCYDHKIRFWEPASGICTKTVLFGESQVNCLQISRDKALIAAGGNPQVNLFDIRSLDEKPVSSYEAHSGNVTAIGFQKESKWFFSGSEDGTIKIWDPRTNKPSRTYENSSPVNTVSLHPNQVELISGDQNGCVKIWDLEADKCREEFTPASAADVAVRSVSVVIFLHIIHFLHLHVIIIL